MAMIEEELFHRALEKPTLGPQHAEFRNEIFYRIALFRGIVLRPNLQYVIDPGGYASRSSAFILGTRLDLSL